MMKKTFILSFLVLSSLFLYSCKSDDSTIAPSVAASSVSGTLSFWDDTPGSESILQLKSNATGMIIYDTCDQSGKFSFTKLQKGTYVLTFNSTSDVINTTKSVVTLEDNQSLTRDLRITYRIFDDILSLKIDSGVVFMKLEYDGGQLGGHYEIVDHLSGYYRNDYYNHSTLGFDIYKIPEGMDWQKPGVVLSADYIRSNFTFLCETSEQPVASGGTHEVRISGATLPFLFSNPANGFALVRKYGDTRELQIPCADNSNNDYGFQIVYK